MSDEMSLWDVENLDAMPRVKDMFVASVSQRETDEFCHRYHYTERSGATNWRWGLWHQATLYGVIGYNWPTRSLCESVFGPDHHQHVWHMGRLAMAEESPRNSESRLIAGSLDRIQREHPEVWAVVTYADTTQKHVGYVYQATNALYTGMAGMSYQLRMADGSMRSTYGTFDGVNRQLTPEEVRERGWTREPAKPKHRYIYILGNKRERRDRRALLKWPVVDAYPKAERGWWMDRDDH